MLVRVRLEIEGQCAVAPAALTAAKVVGVEGDSAGVAGGNGPAWAPANSEAGRLAGAPCMPAKRGDVAGRIASEKDVSGLDLSEAPAVRKRVREC